MEIDSLPSIEYKEKDLSKSFLLRDTDGVQRPPSSSQHPLDSDRPPRGRGRRSSKGPRSPKPIPKADAFQLPSSPSPSSSSSSSTGQSWPTPPNSSNYLLSPPSHHSGPSTHCVSCGHRPFPDTISSYIQLFLNLFAVGLLVGASLHLAAMIKHDVDMKVAEYVADAMADIDVCARHHSENRCEPASERVPAMGRQCDEWAACMQRNPLLVGTSRLSAQTVAEVLDSFVEPISWKTMCFFFLLVVAFVFASNCGFWSARWSARPMYAHTAAGAHYPVDLRHSM